MSCVRLLDNLLLVIFMVSGKVFKMTYASNPLIVLMKSFMLPKLLKKS